ncbi:acetyl/propionyl/methylcrotonyl-CoA carboxylase subunit alpha [Paludibacterium paludis]|uniref:3-methylcrotonyl-CoA carboxylase subunit alpha n=1 Tax=Paludibacterium paludis TaxID=1225769 RepID=A0A918U7K9_9NEIS|nr:acetyl/propionyl/methylcrotonyl-CoA carboxylase subunit alpha [Paludibacterium paludis]GGY06097.1 3-methylcrotonyl-CoA carboxylase subunit alpha [Paludibacterium paludis]
MHCYPLPETTSPARQANPPTPHERAAPALIGSILIANRGEIACRVIGTAKRLGIRTIAVYSDADENARFVRLADEAWRLGPAPAAESYLRADRILDIARASGACAVHPGYGFLSENEAFADACAAAGLRFIGPPASAIAAMGSKSAAKALMSQAGVPLVPGYHGEDQDPARLEREAAAIGYPVLIKASAGGGGKGMRIVERAEDFAAALASCQREAQASFGDDRVLVEKYLEAPRHVEVQVFADTFGECVYLLERDCSVQRRHQKVLEEAPAPHLPAHVRRAMGDAACTAARAVGYVGAGTVEFIMDRHGDFYFMEMNTRLQVEHPVTEMITGLDLVEWQIRVASGQPLPLAQSQISARGHAIEARVYAEDPERGFLPSTGTLTHLSAPACGPHVRIDTGVEENDSISPFYDPMIAKLIVWDETREAALARLARALDDYRVAGVATNLRFLGRIVRHPAFASGKVDTGLIERHQNELFAAEAPATDEELALIALAETLAGHRPGDEAWLTRRDWRLNGRRTRHLEIRIGEAIESLTLEGALPALTIEVRGRRMTARGTLDGTMLHADLEGRKLAATYLSRGQGRTLFVGGRRVEASLIDPFAAGDGAPHGETHLKAPMPGRVVTCCAPVGARVEKGTPLMILEAMKMEHTLAAPANGVVKAFYFAPGDQVDDGADLIDFEAE